MLFIPGVGFVPQTRPFKPLKYKISSGSSAVKHMAKKNHHTQMNEHKKIIQSC